MLLLGLAPRVPVRTLHHPTGTAKSGSVPLGTLENVGARDYDLPVSQSSGWIRLEQTWMTDVQITDTRLMRMNEIVSSNTSIASGTRVTYTQPFTINSTQQQQHHHHQTDRERKTNRHTHRDVPSHRQSLLIVHHKHTHTLYHPHKQHLRPLRAKH